ncbi:MAG: hypothetical protein JXA96_14035 [Sedimentisphaerales bacterium]|nr:hypothetical protein [Sedimentisphaerales bacterium]
MKTIIKIVMLLLFSTLFIKYPLKCNVSLGATDTDIAKYVLNKIIDNRNKIENYKFTFEKIIYESEQSRRNFYEELLKEGVSKEEAESILNTAYIYEQNILSIDDKGCGRAELIIEEMDIKGNLAGEIKEKRFKTWDGKNSIEYIESLDKSSAIIGGEKPALTLTEKYNQPWWTYGGVFCKFLKEALDGNQEVSVEKQSDGKYRIEFLSPSKRTRIGIIDPNQGYSVIYHEHYRDKSEGTTIINAKFSEVKPGIWFPVSGEMIVGNPENPSTKTTMKVNEIKVNKPNFYDGLYHVDFKEGTKVYDKKTGLKYVIGEPMSAKIIGSGSSSLDQVAQKEIERNPSINSEVFIPEVFDAQKEAKPFILNFSDNQLINPKANPESEESDKYLKELGKGDIAWDGKLIAVRGASIITTKQNANKPLKSSKGNWSISYELPEKVEFPYSVLVITKENANYLMNIKKIEPEGITINYKELNSEQIGVYKD